MQPLLNSNSATDIAVTGDFGLSKLCGARLKPRSRCTYAVVFVPTAIGVRTGVLTINNNGSTGLRTVKLSGTAVPPRNVLHAQNTGVSRRAARQMIFPARP